MRPRLALDSFSTMERPRWLTVGVLRLLGLCAFIVAIGMLPGRLTPAKAGWIALIGALVVVAAITLPFLFELRRLTSRLPLGQAVLEVLRHAGLVGLGAAFFLFWTFVYLALWWRHPHEAFAGLAMHPRFADFFYYAVSTAFVSPPGDILAHSRGVRSATMIEMLSGFALLAAYLTSFVDWSRPPRSAPVREADQGTEGPQ